jgi:dimethylaniline monooxygenase (N-oxide forming)
MRTVAIIGAGPGGLVATRYLKKEGFEPIVFEEGDDIGGSGVATHGVAVYGRPCIPIQAG